MRRISRSCFAPLLLAALFAARGSRAADERPAPRSFAQLQTAHYWVGGSQDLGALASGAQVAEELYEDFFATFSGTLQLNRPTSLLPLIVLNERAPAEGRPSPAPRMPGAYSPWTGLAVVSLSSAAAPLNPSRARIRHEATHQLLDRALGLRTWAHDRGFWLREGLACYFEGEGRYRLNGMVRLSRLGVLRVLYAREALPDLHELLAIDLDDPDAEAASVPSYALAWSLCHFLIHGDGGAYRDRFDALLDRVRQPREGDTLATVFAQVFPEPDSLQAAWVRHVHRLLHGDAASLDAGLAPVGSKPHQAATPKEQSLRPSGLVESPALDLATPVSTAKRDEVWAAIRDAPAQPADERWAVLRERFQRDGEALRALASLARSGPDPVRPVAVRALGALRARKAMAVLVDLALHDVSPFLRRDAADAIRTMNYGLAPLDFENTLETGVPAKAQAAAEALAVVGDPASVRALLRALGRLPATEISFSGGGQRRPVTSVTHLDGGKRVYSFRGRSVPTAGTSLGVTKSPATLALERALLSALSALVQDSPGTSTKAWIDWGRQRGLL